MTIIEGLEFVLHTLKCAVNPYPELISAGWSHTAAAIFMVILYFVYFGIFTVLYLMDCGRVRRGVE